MAYAADQTKVSAQSNARTGAIVRFIWHHQAGTNDDATINAMVTGSRQVSATWTVSPAGRITAVVPEERRPWTSASRADDGALTVECANITGPPDYGISDASHEACARLAAYAFRAHGVPLQRATAANGWRGHMGHNEVVGAFGDGYATACPLHLDIDRIIELAADDGAPIGGGQLGQDDSMSAADVSELRADLEALAERVARAERPFLFVALAKEGDPRNGEAWMVRAGGGYAEKLKDLDALNYMRGAGYADTTLMFSSAAELDAALGRFK